MGNKNLVWFLLGLAVLARVSFQHVSFPLFSATGAAKDKSPRSEYWKDLEIKEIQKKWYSQDYLWKLLISRLSWYPSTASREALLAPVITPLPSLGVEAWLGDLLPFTILTGLLRWDGLCFTVSAQMRQTLSVQEVRRTFKTQVLEEKLRLYQSLSKYTFFS